MEVVAAASSIVGILSLVGQSIDGITKLRKFFLDVCHGSEAIDRFLKQINSLLRILQDVDQTVASVPKEKEISLDLNLCSLQAQLKECISDVFMWLRLARDLRPAPGQGGKSWLKKYCCAVNKTCVKDLRQELDRHREALAISLSVLGR